MIIIKLCSSRMNAINFLLLPLYRGFSLTEHQPRGTGCNQRGRLLTRKWRSFIGKREIVFWRKSDGSAETITLFWIVDSRVAAGQMNVWHGNDVVTATLLRVRLLHLSQHEITVYFRLSAWTGEYRIYELPSPVHQDLDVDVHYFFII